MCYFDDFCSQYESTSFNSNDPGVAQPWELSLPKVVGNFKWLQREKESRFLLYYKASCSRTAFQLRKYYLEQSR